MPLWAWCASHSTKGNIMPELNMKNETCFHKNAHGTNIRQMTVYAHDKVTEIFYQKFGEVWTPYKRVVHSVH